MCARVPSICLRLSLPFGIVAQGKYYTYNVINEMILFMRTHYAYPTRTGKPTSFPVHLFAPFHHIRRINGCGHASQRLAVHGTQAGRKSARKSGTGAGRRENRPFSNEKFLGPLVHG